MNNFFCGLHYIVGLADQAAKSLKEWEKVHFGAEKFGATELPRVYESGESRVVRLIRTATGSFQRRGNEQAGAVADFYAFLGKCNFKMPLEEFRGNRNYVIFHNGGGIFMLHSHMRHFLSDIHGETNLLLKAVGADLAVPGLIAGMRALGLLGKLVILSLWKVLEKKGVSIFDMPQYYTELQSSFVNWAMDPSPLLDGTARPFSLKIEYDFSCVNR